ncbi:MAG: hypothetical protein ABL958_11140 [Bdellovibrionia bacterium]
MKALALFVLSFLLVSQSHALEDRKLSVLATGTWNALETRENLGSFLSARLNKSDRPALKKFIKRLPKELPKAQLTAGAIQFKGGKERWTISRNGISIDGKLYKRPQGMNFERGIEHFQKWLKTKGTAANWNPFFSVAMAQTNPLDGLPEPVQAAVWEFMGLMLEAKRIFEINCAHFTVGDDYKATKEIFIKCPQESPNPGKLIVRHSTDSDERAVVTESTVVGGVVQDLTVTKKDETFTAKLENDPDFKGLKWNEMSWEKRFAEPGKEPTIKKEVIKAADWQLWEGVTCEVNTHKGWAYAFSKVCQNPEALNFIRDPKNGPFRAETEKSGGSQ